MFLSTVSSIKNLYFIHLIIGFSHFTIPFLCIKKVLSNEAPLWNQLRSLLFCFWEGEVRGFYRRPFKQRFCKLGGGWPFQCLLSFQLKGMFTFYLIFPLMSPLRSYALLLWHLNDILCTILCNHDLTMKNTVTHVKLNKRKEASNWDWKYPVFVEHLHWEDTRLPQVCHAQV